mgnify:CR=1 FL=1|tara:strand:+ start:37 stop:195 length:159 start_codon:yes stop_codon:yes gene_type:complete
MTLLDVGLLFIFVSNVWVLYVLKKTWYGKKDNVIAYYHDEEGNLQFDYKEDE